MTSSRAITSGLTLALEIGRPLAITGCWVCDRSVHDLAVAADWRLSDQRLGIGKAHLGIAGCALA